MSSIVLSARDPGLTVRHDHVLYITADSNRACNHRVKIFASRARSSTPNEKSTTAGFPSQRSVPEGCIPSCLRVSTAVHVCHPWALRA